MKKHIIKAILLFFIPLIYSCDNKGKNITEIPNIGYYADYLTISSIYRVANISPRLRIRTLDVKTGEIISEVYHELPNLDNNIVQVTEDISSSSFISLGKNALHEDNVIINYYARSGIIDNDYEIKDILFIIDINKINGYFIFSITEINNKENNYLFYETNYFSKEAGSSLTNKNGTLEHIGLFEYFIYSFIYEQTANEIETINTTRLIMNIVNEIYK